VTANVRHVEGLGADVARRNLASEPSEPSAFVEVETARAGSEIEQINKVHGLTDRVALIPLLATEPVGEYNLAALTELNRQAAFIHAERAGWTFTVPPSLC
jgi:hypothetical protein